MVWYSNVSAANVGFESFVTNWKFPEKCQEEAYAPHCSPEEYAPWFAILQIYDKKKLDMILLLNYIS